MASLPSWARVYNEAAIEILGDSPKLEKLLENKDCPFAHEAGVYIKDDNSLWITSNQYPHPVTSQSHIHISRVQLPSNTSETNAECSRIDVRNALMPNGGVNYKDGILFCVQGTNEDPGGIAYVPLDSNTKSNVYEARLFITSFHGRSFNSPNDVVVHSDGSIWFTDPIYGWEQGIRPQPQLPNQVYRYNAATNDIRAVADGFGRPNGICFCPDEKTVYVTDTDWIHGDGTTDDTRASNIYAFDLMTRSGEPFLANRRLFAMADAGIPDGIKCDTMGNVYSGCGDGLNIWSPGGVLLAKVLVDGGIANFCFGPSGLVFLLNETKLWRLQLANTCRGALLGI